MMYERTHRDILSAIVIVGHFGVFLFGFFVLAVWGGRLTADFAHLILMASPVLAATSVAAFTDVISRPTAGRRGRRVRSLYVVVTFAVPVLLILCIGMIFALFAMQSHIASPADLKTALGGIEVFFAGYMTALSGKLFPAQAGAEDSKS